MTRYTLNLYNDISSETYLNFYEKTFYYVYESMDIFIDCDGGDLQYAVAVFDYLNSLKNKGTVIRTFAMSKCKSSALIVFCAGDEKYCYPNTEFMLHPTYVSFDYETIDEVNSALESWKKIDDFYNKIITENFFPKDNHNMMFQMYENVVRKNMEWYINGGYCSDNGFQIKLM